MIKLNYNWTHVSYSPNPPQQWQTYHSGRRLDRYPSNAVAVGWTSVRHRPWYIPVGTTTPVDVGKISIRRWRRLLDIEPTSNRVVYSLNPTKHNYSGRHQTDIDSTLTPSAGYMSYSTSTHVVVFAEIFFIQSALIQEMSWRRMACSIVRAV